MSINKKVAGGVLPADGVDATLELLLIDIGTPEMDNKDIN